MAKIKLLSYLSNAINGTKLQLVDDFLKRTFFASTGNRLTLRELEVKCENIFKKKLNIKWGALNYRKNAIMFPVNFKKKQNICKKEKLDLRLKKFLLE